MISTLMRLALVGACAFASAAAKAKVEVQAVQSKTAGRILAVNLSDDIAPGDYDALIKGITGNPGPYAKKMMLLNSIGGSVPEAIRMGRLLREEGFDAVVPADAVCQGTCVYLLAAGRGKTVRGAVAIHRPYFTHGDSVWANLAGKGVAYSPSAYFKEMNIPANLATDLQAIEPTRMRVLSAQDLARYRLN
ncbi:MAG: hypothetical protein ABWY06_06130 [Pseudomonas sp.]|uniref:COG3904 family protein n=1 Tax=Pseudomonas sp. TaxID=306 RepID=UPI003398BFBB